MISSEAKAVLTCRAPADVVNMAVLWGLGQERGMETVSREARTVVVQAEMKRRSFRGVIDVVYGGEPSERPVGEENAVNRKQENRKRKASALETESVEDSPPPKPVSKREQKRQAKKAKLENAKAQESKDSAHTASAPTVDVLPGTHSPGKESRNRLN